MKKKILLIALITLLLSGCNLFKKEETEVPKKPIQQEEKKDFFEGESIEVTEDQGEMLKTLIEYGRKIYEDKSYTQFEVRSDGTYFIKIDSLNKVYSYDISMFDSSCDLTNSGIIIDPNKLVDSESGDLPVVAMMDCNK